MKRVGKVIFKFFLFNAIPFNVVDSGPYYQSMIDIIVEAGPSIKGPMGYQIGNTYLEEVVEELEVYIITLKAKWLTYGCTIMYDGWSSRTRKPIINLMIYYDRKSKEGECGGEYWWLQNLGRRRPCWSIGRNQKKHPRITQTSPNESQIHSTYRANELGIWTSQINTTLFEIKGKSICCKTSTSF